MKLSDRTLTLLKNFSTINPTIRVEPGNDLKTINPMRSVLAHATVDETFPCEFIIYDLTQFLAALNLVKDADLDFDERFVSIRGGNSKVKYRYADPGVIKNRFSEVKLPSEDVKFHLPEEALSDVLKAASVLSSPEIAFVGQENDIILKAYDSTNSSSNDMSIKIAENPEHTKFNIIYKVENIRLLPRAYNVTACAKGITQLESAGEKDRSLVYYVASASHSTFGK